MLAHMGRSFVIRFRFSDRQFLKIDHIGLRTACGLSPVKQQDEYGRRHVEQDRYREGGDERVVAPCAGHEWMLRATDYRADVNACQMIIPPNMRKRRPAAR